MVIYLRNPNDAGDTGQTDDRRNRFLGVDWPLYNLEKQEYLHIGTYKTLFYSVENSCYTNTIPDTGFMHGVCIFLNCTST